MNKMKHYRSEVNLTQAELAAIVRSTQSAISHYETGRRRPSLNLCRDIVKALVISGAKVCVDDVFPHPAGSDHAAD